MKEEISPSTMATGTEMPPAVLVVAAMTKGPIQSTILCGDDVKVSNERV